MIANLNPHLDQDPLTPSPSPTPSCTPPLPFLLFTSPSVLPSTPTRVTPTSPLRTSLPPAQQIRSPSLVTHPSPPSYHVPRLPAHTSSTSQRVSQKLLSPAQHYVHFDLPPTPFLFPTSQAFQPVLPPYYLLSFHPSPFSPFPPLVLLPVPLSLPSLLGNTRIHLTFLALSRPPHNTHPLLSTQHLTPESLPSRPSPPSPHSRPPTLTSNLPP